MEFIVSKFGRDEPMTKFRKKSPERDLLGFLLRREESRRRSHMAVENYQFGLLLAGDVGIMDKYKKSYRTIIEKERVNFALLKIRFEKQTRNLERKIVTQQFEESLRTLVREEKSAFRKFLDLKKVIDGEFVGRRLLELDAQMEFFWLQEQLENYVEYHSEDDGEDSWERDSEFSDENYFDSDSENVSRNPERVILLGKVFNVVDLENTDCSICLEAIESGIVLECTHSFHESCLHRHIITGTNFSECPNCRQKI